MARKVDAFPGPKQGEKSARYPDEWFDGSIWEVVPGEDSRSPTPELLKKMLYQSARAREVRIRTSVRDGRVYVQRI